MVLLQLSIQLQVLLSNLPCKKQVCVCVCVCVCVSMVKKKPQMNADATYLPTRWRSTPAFPVFSYRKAGNFDHPKNHFIPLCREHRTQNFMFCRVHAANSCFDYISEVSRVRLLACQASPSMGFSRQEYWSGWPFPSSGDLPHPGIEPSSPTVQADALPSEPPGRSP